MDALWLSLWLFVLEDAAAGDPAVGVESSVECDIGGGDSSSSGCEEKVQFAEGLSFHCIVVGVSVLGV